MRIPAIKYYFPVFIINHNLISIIQGVEVENNKQEDGKNGYPNGFEVDFFHHGFSSESGYFSSKVILFSSDTCKSKIFRIFVLSDQWLGSKMAPENRGFFNPIQYGGGLVFVPETGDPDQESDSGNGHRFYLVAVKNKVHASYLTLDMMLHKTEQLTQERRVA